MTTEGEGSLTFEEEVRRLEEIVRALEAEDVLLERSLELFEEGTRLIRSAQEKLARGEARVQKLLKEMGGGVTLEEFSPEE